MSSSISTAFPPSIIKDETIQHFSGVWMGDDKTFYDTSPAYTLPGRDEPCGIAHARRLRLNVELTEKGKEIIARYLSFRTRDGHPMEIAYKPTKANKERDWTNLTQAEITQRQFGGVFIRQPQTTPFRYKHIKFFTWKAKKCYFIRSVISSSYDSEGVFKQSITQHFYKTEVPGSFPVGDSRIAYTIGLGVVLHDTPDDGGRRLRFVDDVVRDRAAVMNWKADIPLTMIVHEHTNIYVNDELFADMENHRTPMLPLMTMKMMKVREIEDEVYDKTSYPQQQRILRANLMRDVIEKALHPDLVARRVEQYGLDWIDLINP
jgi:hypothetical protein